MLMLFTIGLKLKIKSFSKKEIWGAASLHLILSVLAISGIMTALSFTGLSLFADLHWQSSLLISFALSFSSTVFVVKTLESSGEFDSYHGKLAIGILVIQDIFAVLFITFSDKKIPSLWILTLPFILWGLKKVLSCILCKIEHGELVPLFGFFATFITGTMYFSLLGLKADLGALVMGMLLVNHSKAEELYKRMSEFKDFFLIAFFLNVGLVGLPNFSIIGGSLVLLLPLIIFKGLLFFYLFSKFKLQPRTAYLGALSLTNFSEFGLIVGMVGLNMGLISNDWLIAMAILMSLSFIIAAPLNTFSHHVYDKFKNIFLRINTTPIPTGEDVEPTSFGDAEYIVVGLGSVGKHAFETLRQEFGHKVLGLDYDVVASHLARNENVQWADTTDSQLWENVNCSNIKAIFMTMSNSSTNLNSIEAIHHSQNKNIKIFSISHYDDEKEEYLKKGVDFTFVYKNHLGYHYVKQALEHIHQK